MALVLHLVAAIKLGAIAIGVASALVLGASAQAGVVNGHPHLESSAAGSLFDGSQVLYPGSPAQARTTTLTFSGSATAGVVGLFAQNYQPQGPAALALCTAADPGRGYDLTASSDGAAVYHGTLAGFVAGHGASQDVLVLPGSWKSGNSHAVTISVSMPKTDGNEYMGCSPTTDFVWFAE
ncbi:MAG: hypothetical protein M3Z98_01505 [Candidatus Dormibacteraeota bacterium]|nr:hypothetical protein [Candidatus Dormibacteraeota bacterium]